MRWLSLGCLVALVGCGPARFEQQRLKDGSIQTTCQVSMDECVRFAQESCKNQRFRILEGTSETRLRDAPPFEKAYHTSRLHLLCTDDGANVLLSVGGSKTPGSASAPAAEASAACSLGQTRECIGPGACKGGQSCLPDAKGFGPCDCGPAASTPVVAPSATTPVSTESVAPTPTPATTPPATP